jgi:septal ring factor EnvC (AmiA/AmiB activator)
MILAATKVTDWLPVVSALLGSGVITALFKLRPERESIVASATKQAVEVFEASIKQLQEDLAAAQAEAQKLSQELAHVRTQLEELQKLRVQHEAEIARLRSDLNDCRDA